MNKAATTWALVGIDEYDDQRLRRLQGAAADALEAVDAYCKLLLATGFRRQFLIMDGCLNYPYADNARTQIPAEGFPGVTGVTPDPANGLIACFAAAQDQRAAELDGRGAFMGPLLQALDPDRPWPDAVDLDFETGVRSVDIEKLVRKFVGPLVERQVFERAKLRQSPRVEPLGTAQGSQVLPVYQLPQVETSTVDVTIEPAQAVPSVQAVLLSVRRRPFWGLPLRKPPANAVEVAVVSRLPKGLPASVICEVDPTAAWDVVEAQLDFETDQDRTCRFTFAPLATPEPAPEEAPRWESVDAVEEVGPVPSATPPVEVFGVHTVSPSGQVVPELDPLYPEIAQSLGMERAPAWEEVEVASGVTMTRHETGPEFRVQEGARAQAGQLVREWAKAVREAAPTSTSGVSTPDGGARCASWSLRPPFASTRDRSRSRCRCRGARGRGPSWHRPSESSPSSFPRRSGPHRFALSCVSDSAGRSSSGPGRSSAWPVSARPDDCRAGCSTRSSWHWSLRRTRGSGHCGL